MDLLTAFRAMNKDKDTLNKKGGGSVATGPDEDRVGGMDASLKTISSEFFVDGEHAGVVNIVSL